MESEQNSLRLVAAWLLKLLAGGSASNALLAKEQLKPVLSGPLGL